MVPGPFHKLIIKFIEGTNKPIFLTGKAGTGKTTFLRYIKANVTKNMAVVAPTAVAAINAGGVTIHSFFQVPFGPQVPAAAQQDALAVSLAQISQEKAKLLKCLDLLIIDEISMVRADTLDYIDRVLRQLKGSIRPFGGVQLLMIGDLFQLPPVYEKDWPVLRNFYKGPYFFNSLAFQKFPVLTFELTQVYRQNDPVFVNILNHIRNGEATAELLKPLNARYDTEQHNQPDDYVTLSTHNQLVNQINQARLQELAGAPYTFKAVITGDFPKEGLPADEELVLKVGAQVMFIKNDSSGKKQYYNGRTARVIAITDTSIRLSFLDDASEFDAVPESWQNVKYTLSETDQKVNEANNGSFSQYPLRLAWAITVHKSQGLTFEKAMIDVDAAFAFGQTYVALSRCRTLEGIVLKKPVRPENIRTDPDIIRFMQQAAASIPDEQLLQQTIRQYEMDILLDVFDFSSMAGSWQQVQNLLLINETAESLMAVSTQQTTSLLHQKIKTIGDRFIKKELTSMSQGQHLWEDAAIAGRLKNAASYFIPQLNAFGAAVNSCFSNKAGTNNLPAEFYDHLNLLLVQLKAKTAAFIRIPIATAATDMLSAIQEAGVIYQPVLKSWNSKTLPKEKEILHPQLYQQLLVWRKNISSERKVMEHTLVSENMLRDVTAKLPRSLNQLAQLKSFGDAKAADFGDQILKLIRGYLGENDLFS